MARAWPQRTIWGCHTICSGLGYATGVFSSRKLERATYDSIAFRFIAANDHPDHDTIAAFRRRFLKETGRCSFRLCC